jgi:hypothetical protein
MNYYCNTQTQFSKPMFVSPRVIIFSRRKQVL